MRLVGDKVISRYPWIKNPSELKDNYDLAYRRLLQTEKRLLKDPVAAQQYEQQIQDMLDRGVARKLTDQENAEWISDENNPVQYLPHHEVLKPSSASTPVRIVFDPSSEYKGQAVNNFWGTGPNLILNPLGLQIRFRENLTAVAGDIAKMYQTIHTTPMEWHCHRFLWRNLDQTKDPETYIILRNSFGSRPAGTVAIAALHLVADAGESRFPIGSRTIREQSYVDDLLDSTRDKSSANELINQTNACLALGSFKVKGWTVVDGRDVLPCQETDPSTQRQIGGSEETVLGTFWDTASDSFLFKAGINFSKRKKRIRQGPDLEVNEIFTLSEPLTLRGILSQVNGYYDPMGLVGPYLVELKFNLGKLWKVMNTQEISQSGSVWDLPIPPEYDELWRKLLNAAFHVENLRFARHLTPENAVGQPWLIMFGDSSMMAFATCAYIRWTLSDNSIWCRLIASKSRIWPITANDFISVCRGELQSAVLAKRLAQTIINESRFDFEKVLYIIDSEIVRAQIAKDGHAFDVFVGNRVGEIRAKTTPDQWYHIPGSENVSADLLSRGSLDTKSMDAESAWQNGPSFLYKPFPEWPTSQRYLSEKPLPELRDLSLRQRTMAMQAPRIYESADLKPQDIDESADLQCRDATGPSDSRSTDATESAERCDPYGDCSWSEALACFHAENAPIQDQTRQIVTRFDPSIEAKIADRIDVTRFSKLRTLLAVTYRFLHVLSWKKNDGHFVKFMPKFVSSDQLELALQFWLRQAQRELKNNIVSGKYTRLKPVMDDETGIYRINGRFGDHPHGYHPILLPRCDFVLLITSILLVTHNIYKLQVTSIHQRGHGGATATAAKVKDQYHVLGIRELAKTVRRACILCRRLEKRLLRAPMAPLPSERFRPSYAFEHCSCDIFGPFLLQAPGRATRGRPMTSYGKGYGLIITCLSTRAIHIEAMEGQDTSAFLCSFRRFMSVRGQPRFMWSDNASQIVAADEELKSIVTDWDDDKLREFGAQNGIKWQYIAPGSPWQNGVSESLIKSVKRSMAMLFQSKPRVPIMDLQTLFYEIAATLNERPINLGHCEVPGDWDSDVNTYLCPNQLLLGRSSIRIPSGPFTAMALPHTQHFHNLQTICNQWWDLWSSLYLPTLLSQSKWHYQDRTVTVGDIVFVRDTNLVRGNWQIAEIIRADPSPSDGLVRRVEVRYKKLPDEPSSMYSGTPDKTESRDVKNLVVLLTADERRCAR